nr:M56 family metallopeptidase [uncultured Mediterraneibacter sp.]
MSYTFGPFFICFIMTLLLTGYLHFILHISTAFQRQLMKFSFIGILLILVRMLIPLNFPFTYSIYSYHLLPELLQFTTEPIADSNITIQDSIMTIWIAITCVLLIKFIIQYARLCHYISSFYITNDESWSWLFDLCRKNYSRPLNIAIIKKPISPAIIGLFKPTLILPDIESFSNEELEYICLHEIAHYKQHHLWISFFMEIICCVHWWNPVMKYFKTDYALFLELSNDFYLIRSHPNFNTLDYAGLIIKTAKNITSKSSTPFYNSMHFVIKNTPALTTRIKHIINYKQRKSTTRTIYSISCCIFLCISIISAIFLVPEVSYRKISPAQNDGTTQITKENSFIVKTENKYLIYVDQKYFASVSSIPDELHDIPVYSTEEVRHKAIVDCSYR